MMLTLLILAANVAAVTSAPPPASQADRKICRTYEETGSRIRRQRTCRTAAEWRKLDTVEQRDTERMLEGRRLQTLTH